MLNVGIIGCGGIGQYHFRHLIEFKDVKMVAFCDLVKSKAEEFANKAGGAAVYTDYRLMLDEIKPDVVFVCIPPYCHGQVEYDIIERGLPFFVEKPVALDIALARDIRDRIKAKGLITGTGFQCRYSNLNPPTRQFIEENEIVYINCTRMGGVPGVDWWRHKDMSGGQIVEQTIHQFDLIRYLYGEPELVFTLGARGFVNEVEDYDTDDASVTAVRFANGAIATIATGCYAKNGEAFDSKITFSARDCRCDHYLLSKVDVYKEQKKEATENTAKILKDDGVMAAGAGSASHFKQDGDAGIECDRTFLDAVISGDPSKIRSPYEDAVKTLVFTMSCNKSMETGLPVKIEY